MQRTNNITNLVCGEITAKEYEVHKFKHRINNLEIDGKTAFNLFERIRTIGCKEFEILRYLYENGDFEGGFSDLVRALNRPIGEAPNIRKSCLAMENLGLIAIFKDADTHRVTSIELSPYWMVKLIYTDNVK